MSQSYFDSLEEVGDSLMRIRKHLNAIGRDIEGIESAAHGDDPRFESSLDHVRMADRLVESSSRRLRDAINDTPSGASSDISEKGTGKTDNDSGRKPEVVIEKVPVKRSVKGYVRAIVFFLLTTVAAAVAAGYFYDEWRRYQRKYESASREASKGRSELERVNSERQTISAELEELQSFKQSYDNRFPIKITSFEFGNGRYDSQPSIYGERMYASDLYYVYTRISYVGNVSGSRTLKLKWYRNDALWKGSNSPSGCTYTSTLDVSTGDNTAVLGGWGSNTAGNSWSSGTYRIEVWYGDNFIAASSLTVY